MMRLDCTVSCLVLLYPINSLRPSTHRDIHATVVCQQGAEKIHKWHQRRVRCRQLEELENCCCFYCWCNKCRSRCPPKQMLYVSVRVVLEMKRKKNSWGFSFRFFKSIPHQTTERNRKVKKTRTRSIRCPVNGTISSTFSHPLFFYTLVCFLDFLYFIHLLASLTSTWQTKMTKKKKKKTKSQTANIHSFKWIHGLY